MTVGKPVGPDNDIRSFFPLFLRDGNHFFYTHRGPDGSSSGQYLATLDEPIGHRVLADLSSVAYAPPASSGVRAYLLFRRENTLMAQPFDEESLQPMGDPFTVAGDLGSRAAGLVTLASVAEDGTLVYLAGASSTSQLTWFDRTGQELGKVGPQTFQFGVALSPDGRTVAIQLVAARSGDWL
jgi:hypothetical protein